MSPRKALLSLLFLVSIYCLILLEWPWAQRDHWKDPYLGPLLPVLSYLSLSHRMRLYVPEPPRSDLSVTIEITNAQGLTQPWQFPRDRMFFWEPSGSYRRYLTNYFIWSLPEFPKMPPPYWNDLARYITRQLPQPPAKIAYVLLSSTIPPLHSQGQPPRRTLLFTYGVP